MWSILAMMCMVGFSGLFFADEMGQMKDGMKGELGKMKDDLKGAKNQMKGKTQEMKGTGDEMKTKREGMKGEMPSPDNFSARPNGTAFPCGLSLTKPAQTPLPTM